MKKLVLFDIDGTLIRCGNTPRQAITKALEIVYGTRGSVDRYSFSGKTDLQIVYEVMTLAGLDQSYVESNLESALENYVTFLDASLRTEDVRILSGIIPLLGHLKRSGDVALGLLTGNVLKGAQIKLARAGIGNFFFNGRDPMGAFGSDAMDRSALPPIAVERAFKRHKYSFKEKEIVVIGDSPSDVVCGKSLNVRSVAVATGWHSKDELETYQPDLLFDDLSDTQRVLEGLLN